MKTRLGFISNSSSSSFVLIGVVQDLEDRDVDRDAYKPLRVLLGEEDGMPDGKVAIGVIFDAPSDDCLDFEEIELDGVIQQLREKGLTDPLKIVTGTRCC